jgi:hypothetical protein
MGRWRTAEDEEREKREVRRHLRERSLILRVENVCERNKGLTAE